MATTPDEERQQVAFLKNISSAARDAVAHPRFRDTFVPSIGLGAVVLGTTANIAAALGASLLTFALLDKRK
jgi:hypothetical protein